MITFNRACANGHAACKHALRHGSDPWSALRIAQNSRVSQLMAGCFPEARMELSLECLTGAIYYWPGPDSVAGKHPL